MRINWHSYFQHSFYFQLEAKKVDKPKISRLIVSALRCANPPSRFLRLNDGTNQWEDVGDKRAAEKVSQTLREKEKTEKASPLRGVISVNWKKEMTAATANVRVEATQADEHDSSVPVRV